MLGFVGKANNNWLPKPIRFLFSTIFSHFLSKLQVFLGVNLCDVFLCVCMNPKLTGYIKCK